MSGGPGVPNVLLIISSKAVFRSGKSKSAMRLKSCAMWSSDRDRNRAPQRINGLDPLQVFETLRTKLPYDETRRYLAKVMNAKKEFVNF